MLSIFVHPSLPLPQGDRLVQIRNWDVAANSAEQRALHDFNIWRSTLRSVTELGAWRDVTRNLIVTEGDARPVQVAEITPAAFRVADGTPLMGRVLMEADERPGAPSVVVIGYDVWRTRFGRDPAVLGRSVQLGTEHVNVVGVMREGFEFPIAHDVWTPLRILNDAHAPRSGPGISVFGVLAPGATLETAQAELTAIGLRVASEQPATHARLQPHVAPYAMLDAGPSQDDDIGIRASIYFFAVMLLVLVCSNVALLLFARAATRESEFTVRTALGASRSRIVAQMFAEALVLGGVAALAGLLAAHVVLQNWGLTFLEVTIGRLPFWYDVEPLAGNGAVRAWLDGAGFRNRGSDARAQGHPRHGFAPEAGNGRRRGAAVRRHLDRRHRRASRRHRRIPRRGVSGTVAVAARRDVRHGISNGGIPLRADPAGHPDGRRREHGRNPRGTPRRLRRKARGTAPARRC